MDAGSRGTSGQDNLLRGDLWVPSPAGERLEEGLAVSRRDHAHEDFYGRGGAALLEGRVNDRGRSTPPSPSWR